MYEMCEHRITGRYFVHLKRRRGDEFLNRKLQKTTVYHDHVTISMAIDDGQKKTVLLDHLECSRND